MNRRGGILLAAVLALSAMFRANMSLPGSAQIPAAHSNNESNRIRNSPSAGGPEDAKAEGEKYQIAELHKAVDEFFETNSSNSSTANDLNSWGIPPSLPIRFVIATLADPVHTHLALFFDRQIEAIQQAAQSQHYAFDRAVLPWDNKNHPEPDNFLLRETESKWQEGREDYPGLLIFRSTPEQPTDALSPLFVFTVGETPTGGLERKQFLHALDIIYAMRGNSTDSSLRLLGPTFSGSFYSLYQLLSAENNKIPAQIYARSGVVSGWRPAEWFQTQMKNHVPGRSVQFVSFQESDRYRIRQLIAFLENQGYSPYDIALLSEDETQYGAIVNSQATSRADPKHPPGFCQENFEQMSQCENSILQLYFPREISHLRAAYQQDIYGDDESDRRTPRSGLKLDMENVGSDDDTVASYSHKQMPLSQEAVLLGIVRALREHKSTFVVLKATDPMDLLFLARFLRKAYGELRIVTFDADLLFHRQDEDTLVGVLSLTNYELFPGMHEFFAEKFSKSKPRADRSLSSGVSVGNYNAMLSLLVNEPGLKSPCQPSDKQRCQCDMLPTAPYEQYSWPVWPSGEAQNMNPCWRTPPLWLTVVGRGGYWPLAILNPPSQKNANALIPSRLHAAVPEEDVEGKNQGHHIHRSWEVFVGLWILAAFAHLLLVHRGSVLARSELLARFAPVQDWRRSVVLAIASVLLFSGVIMLFYITPIVPWRVILGVAAALLVVWPAWDLSRRGTRRTAIAYLILSTLAFIFISWVFYFLKGDETLWHLVIFRSVHVTSAVSPLLPPMLLIAAGYWWAWHNLSGLSFLDHRRPRLPNYQKSGDAEHTTAVSPKFPYMIGITEQEARKLVKVARPFAFDTRILLPVIFLVLVLLFCFAGPKRPIQSLEGRVYDYIYASLIAIFVLALFIDLARLMVVWVECRRLLLSLDRLALRRAFSRLKGFSWKPIWRLGGSSIRDSYNLISRQFESITHLQNALEQNALKYPFEQTEQMKTALDDALKMRNQIANAFKSALESEAKSWFRSNPRPSQQLIEEFKKLQKKIAEVCGVILSFLAGVWVKETGFVAANIRNGKNEGPHDETRTEPSQPTLVALAEEFVALVYVNFILHFLLRIRTFVLCVSGMFVFILASLNSYPFEPRSALQSIMVGVFLLIGIVVAMVYADMHKNVTLSHVTDTTPGELGLDFWVKLAAFGAIPLLSLLAAQFPEVNRFFFSWLEPAMEALK